MTKFITLIDAHVHIYDMYDFRHFINAAFNNFRKNSYKISSNINYEGVLCLTESKGKSWFNDLPNKLKENGDCKIVNTSENNSFICYNNNRKIYIISGKQIVTKENIEVLGLGVRENIIDGKSIDEVISIILSKNGLPVIPWGFGKWFGKRGKIISSIVIKNNRIYLGDSGNRPSFLPKSKLFSIAGKSNIKNLPGTDPLPFKGQQNRPGSYGFYFEGLLSEEEPFKDLVNKIMISRHTFKTFGRMETPIRFFYYQLLMKLK